MTDINEQVKEEWKATTTGRERVKEILTETTEYTKASVIAKQALVSEPTTRKYLTELVDEGIGSTRQDGRTTLYKRNEGHRINNRIEELRRTHSHRDLIAGIQEMNETLQEFRETYDVENPEDLAIKLEPGDNGWKDIGKWRATRQNLALAKAALQVDEAHRLAEA
ncbi:winged helix-turn-helix domain-containing protein [Haladaptatus sp. DFWS20]|uniref:winged helix-turn-helix domain-containing protein n=1 Tax=Haladaptatus sp. DFWS20 TaxID=3403467 RepID=UPI003EBDB933